MKSIKLYSIILITCFCTKDLLLLVCRKNENVCLFVFIILFIGILNTLLKLRLQSKKISWPSFRLPDLFHKCIIEVGIIQYYCFTNTD